MASKINQWMERSISVTCAVIAGSRPVPVPACMRTGQALPWSVAPGLARLALLCCWLSCKPVTQYHGSSVADASLGAGPSLTLPGTRHSKYEPYYYLYRQTAARRRHRHMGIGIRGGTFFPGVWSARRACRVMNAESAPCRGNSYGRGCNLGNLPYKKKSPPTATDCTSTES